MERDVSIVLSTERHNYRKLAQSWYGLTDEQMIGMDVHHNPPRYMGGRNVPEHLYVYHPALHREVHKTKGNSTVLVSRSRTVKKGVDRKKIMECNLKVQRALAPLEAVFSAYDEEIEKLEEEIKSLRDELEKTRENVVSVAHEYGMSSNDSQFCNALLFIKKNLSQFQTTQEKAKEMGYSSLNNLLKGVWMTTADKRNRKTRTHFEKVLPKELVELPIGLQLTKSLSDTKTIDKLLVKTVYPTFEQYLQCPKVNMEKLLALWSQVGSIDDLNYVKNWCVERMRGILEETPKDLSSLGKNL